MTARPHDVTMMQLPRVPCEYVVVPFGNRWVIEARRGEVRVRVTASEVTREEAEATAERLRARHRLLNGVRD